MSASDHLKTREEIQLLNRAKREGFALPKAFQKWKNYFFTERSYIRELTRWMSEKTRTNGGFVKIESDMEPDTEASSEYEEKAFEEGGGQRTWCPDFGKSTWKQTPPVAKTLGVKPPSGQSLPEGAEPHIIF